MAGKTKSPAPITDGSYWRRLMSVAHPDKNGGDHELCLFLQGVREHVESCASGPEPSSRRREPKPSGPGDRDFYEPAAVAFGHNLGHEDLLQRLEEGVRDVREEVERIRLGEGLPSNNPRRRRGALGRACRRLRRASRGKSNEEGGG